MLAIHDMAEATIKMVTESIDAFVGKDVSMAEDVIKYDDVVDNYFDKVKTILIELFSKPETDGEYALDLLMIAKYFERIGDHAVNIAEWVLFSLTGSRKVEGK
ncbi:MAG: phosphate transport system regulatory protein PhoU, partial [Clostridia bacterium]|nr:phosphate transport system regulatory protein PhoU [Clostridia bacterium]